MTEKPEADLQAAPDLPDLPDEDAAPTFKSYMLSREVRGWAVGMAAVVVALAAVAPSVDMPDLRGSIIDRNQVRDLDLKNIDANVTCTAQDQTGGIGGQTVKCAFTCPDGPGTVSVSVDADDNDAQVSGTASCGDGNAHCSGKDSCGASDTRTSGGPGACSADSDEAVDSGLYVECSSSTDNIPHPGDDIGSEWCPVTEPEQVCIQPACAQLANNLQTTCQNVWSKMVDSVGRYQITMAAMSTEHGGAGLLCKGYVCTPFEVQLLAATA